MSRARVSIKLSGYVTTAMVVMKPYWSSVSRGWSLRIWTRESLVICPS